MKIKKSVLVDALKVLGKVVSQTSPVEVQRSVRLLGVGEQVWMTATDGVESVTVEVTGNAGEMEVFTVEYKALRELIRSTRGGEVEVTGKQLEWPEMEAVPDDAITVELPPDFGRLLALAAPVVNLREARLALRGINLSRDGVTATNGKELLNLPCPLKIPEDMTLPFPLALLTARPEEAGTLHVWRYRNERLFRIVIGGFQWQGKALPGNFPDWKQVISADKTSDYQIEIHEPERIITFLKAVPDCPPFHAVELNVVPGGVTVIPNNFPDMELRLEATVVGAQPRAVLALLFSLTLGLWSDPEGGDEKKTAFAEGTVRFCLRFWFCPLMMLLYCGIEFSMGLWVYQFLSGCRGFSAESAGFAVAGYWGMLTAGRFLIGCVANRLGNRRQIRFSMVLGFIGAMLLLIPGPVVLTLAAAGVIGFAFASFYPAMMHAAPERFDPATAATVIGYQGGAGMLGTAVIPAAFGYLAARTTFALLPWFVAAVTVIIFLLQWQVDGRRK